MVSNGNIRTTGYETEYKKLYAIINSERHQQVCGECRPCGVIQEVIKVLMETLAGQLTQEEFYTVAILLTRTNTGIRDREGRIGPESTEALEKMVLGKVLFVDILCLDRYKCQVGILYRKSPRHSFNKLMVELGFAYSWNTGCFGAVITPKSEPGARESVS